MAFKERLRELRVDTRYNYSGEELGKLVGVSKQTISHWEKGRYEPNLAQVVKLCTIFGVSSDDLLRGTQERPATLTEDEMDMVMTLREQRHKRSQMHVRTNTEGQLINPSAPSPTLKDQRKK